MTAQATAVIGSRLRRKEDLPLLTGRARFVADVVRPGMLHAAIVRSPFAHAHVASIDIDAARALEGVRAVLTASDLPDRDLRIPIRLQSPPEMDRYLQRPLASDVVRYAGEPVAVVVADSAYVAEDARDAVDVVYEPRAPVLDAVSALAADAPILHAQSRTNLVTSFVIERGDVNAAFAEADVVVEERITCGRHAAVPLETRGLLAEIDDAGILTVWGAAKIPHVNWRILASLLGWPEEQIRLVEMHVGGGFGARGEFYPEDFLIPYCATRLGRPVRWVEDREESLRATNHSRQQVHEAAIALRSDGTFLGLRDRFYSDAGAYVRTHGVTVPNMTAAFLHGPYAWPAYRAEANHVVTTMTPTGTYRSPGRYEANLVRERLIDAAARRLERDPADLRRQNLIRPEQMPYDTGTHTFGHPNVFDSGDYPLLLEKGLTLFDYDAARRWRAAAGPSRARGIGLGFFVEKSGIARWEYARVEIMSTGKTVVYSGGASVGQGIETVLAQICAQCLGVAYDDVTVVHGDTSVVPDGLGAFGSRVSVLGGSAVAAATERLRRRLLALAALHLEIDARDLEVLGDRVAARDSASRALTLAELHALARPEHALPLGVEPGLSAEGWFHCDDMNFPYGLHCVAAEVDLETGGVEISRYAIACDVGRPINPTLVEGQFAGGAAQGIGGALYEELAYSDDGQLSSSSFMDYLLPTAREVPSFELLATEDAPSPLNPLGVKGAGEGGIAAAGAAIANAVSDALGAEATTLPLTPERVLSLAHRAGP